jgi:competence protein ComEC
VPPVARFALAYVAGLWAGGLVPASLALLAAAALAAAALAWTWRRAAWRGVLLGVAAAGLLQGTQAAARRRAECAERWEPGRHAAILRLNDGPDPRSLTTARVLHAVEGCGGDIRVRLAAGAAPSGATILAVGQYAAGGALRLERFRLLPAPRPLRFVVRDAISRRVSRLYGPRAPLVDALVIDRKGAIEPRLRADFAASGLAHLLAISGLHVGIVAGWVILIARGVGLRRRAWGLAVAASWGYVALLGFPAPATRAAAFVAVQALARRGGRHPPAHATLAVAVLVVVLLDPAAVTSIGAWLSVAAVAGTGAAGAVLRSAGWRGAHWRLLATSVGATLATAPITAYAFGAVAPIGVVVNLMAVPLAALAQPAVFLSLAAGAVAPGAGLALAGLERIAALGAAVPGGHLEGDPGVSFALPWAAALAAAVWWYRRRPTWAVLRLRAAGLVAAVAWLSAAARVPGASARYPGLTIHVLSVGQGDGMALRTPNGRWVLVDAGPRLGGDDAGRRIVVPFLRRQGARALDAVIVSHGHDDHLGGVPAVLARLPAALVLEPGQPVATPLYQEYLGAVDRAGARWQAARAGDTLVVDGVRLAVLHPNDAWMRRETDLNENSVVLRVTYGAFDALFTGDAGWPAESALAGTVGPVELLKVGHHGSSGGSRAPWLRELVPRAAVISAGRNNRYGHPAPEVLARLAGAGVAVYRTDAGGTVTIRSDGRYFEVSQGDRASGLARWACIVRGWLPSRASSSSRNGCTPRPPASSPTSFTTWPSPPR